MIIDLRELRLKGEPLEVEGLFTNDDLKVNSGVMSLVRPAEARVRLELRGDSVRVSGNLKCDVSVTCCRCTKGFQKSLEKRFGVDYWPDPAVEDGEEFELTYSDLDVGFYRNDELDLSAVLGEQVLLEIPMKPVCREDCKGLCDQCGADLNEGECSCERTRVDPRMASLVEYKKKRFN